MIGQIISHYRILEKLGEGGMGVVYKAEDTKLRRTVALKFLPVHAMEHRERFLREAQAAAALNHPNICTVHEIDDEHGFIAMEFIEGPSVKQKIETRPLPLEEALDIAMQACTGLQAAHDRGIVHRDIKPANIMLTAQGQVKIMDFGLAQVNDRSRLTKSNASMGTPAYMSPQQTQAQTVDRRTDIWSLGATVYEMIAGKQPFSGGTEAAYTYSIVHTEPEPLTALRSGLPKDLDRIISKGLAKHPDNRYQHIEDLLIDLRSLRGIATKASPARRPARRTPILIVLSLAAMGLLLWAGSFLIRSKPPQAVHLTVDLASTDSDETEPGTARGHPAIAPDGSAVVLSLRRNHSNDLYYRGMDSPKLTRLEGTQNAVSPFWSPDSRFVAFFADNQLKKIAAAGGVPIVICPALSNRGGSWSQNSVIIFSLWGKGLFRVPETGGEPAVLTTLDMASGDNDHRYPQFLPDGERFLYFNRNLERERRGIFLESLNRQQPRRKILAADGFFALGPGPYTGRHYLVTQQDGKIVAQQFLISQGAVTGEPRVIHDVAGPPSVSQTGSLVFRQQTDDPRLVWFNREGKETGVLGPEESFGQLEISPDNRRIAVLRTDSQSGSFVIWLASAEQGFLGPVSDPKSRFAGPVFSRDGKWLYFSDQDGYRIFRRAVESSTPVEQVSEDRSLSVRLRDISPDLQTILADARLTLSHSILWRSMDGKEWKTLASGGAEMRPKFSPDGRWVAFDSIRSGAREVYVTDFPAAARTFRISSSGGLEPHWRGDGKEICYISEDEFVWCAGLPGAGVFAPLQPKKLFQVPYQSSPLQGSIFGVTPDGNRFLVSTRKRTPRQFSLNIILNWPSLLERGTKP